MTNFDGRAAGQALRLAVMVNEADDVAARELSHGGPVNAAQRTSVGFEHALEAPRVAAVRVDEFAARGSVVTHLADGADGVDVDDCAAAARLRSKGRHFGGWNVCCLHA